MHDRWKLLSNEDGKHFELYDLADDPLEKRDLSGQKPQVVTVLKQKLEEWKATLPDKPSENCFSEERGS